MTHKDETYLQILIKKNSYIIVNSNKVGYRN
jgi:hypothetical protein